MFGNKIKTGRKELKKLFQSTQTEYEKRQKQNLQVEEVMKRREMLVQHK